MGGRLFKVGDRVMLRIRPTNATQMLSRYNGGFYTVSKVTRTGELVTYELEGVQSDFHIPYTIHSDWMLPVVEKGGK